MIALNGLKYASVQTALDMGCGSGILAIAIAKRWRCPVIASDKDIKAVRKAKKKVAKRKPAKRKAAKKRKAPARKKKAARRKR